jgi:hypothetical protein
MSGNRVDVVQLVRDGKARYEWHWITSSRGAMRLRIAVMRDAMKFDGMMRLNWNREPVTDGAADNKVYDGVRLPASAEELQQIADLVGGMLMTPRVVDLIWLQAGLRFDANVNSGPPNYDIVATMDITQVHELIEADIESLGGDKGDKLISCVGKYWVLVNELEQVGKVEGGWASCNYGWCAKSASGPGVTQGVQCWQRPGYKHNLWHLDPSQTIRLMWKRGELSDDEGESWEDVELAEVAADPELAPLLTHDGKALSYLRQKGVDEQPAGGHIVLPPVAITILTNGGLEPEDPSDPKAGNIS